MFSYVLVKHLRLAEEGPQLNAAFFLYFSNSLDDYESKQDRKA